MQAVLVLKYVVPDYGFPALYFGIANVVSNGLIMLRFVQYPVCMLREFRTLILPQLGCSLGFAEHGR